MILRHPSLSTLALLLSCICVLFGIHIDAYLVLVDSQQPAGTIIFNASVQRLAPLKRNYTINSRRSALFVHSLVTLNNGTGELSLLQSLDCQSLYYPDLFSVHIDSVPSKTGLVGAVDLYSVTIRILIIGPACQSNDVSDTATTTHLHRSRRHLDVSSDRLWQAKHWPSHTVASYAVPTGEYWHKVCLRRSQLISSIRALVPATVVRYCNITYDSVGDPRFQVEHSQGDLVASQNICLTQNMWKVKVDVSIVCPLEQSRVVSNQHHIYILYHHQRLNDSDLARRVRRELRNQSPFFEKPLYLVNVLEECEPKVIVTGNVKARDPENNPITYSMSSLLDSRAQHMFEIEPTTGIVRTKVKLDRELVDVHYFSVTAMDDSFPPRSGTTMLQINVLDANDHAPVFEMNEYDASIREGVSIGSTVITLKATDQDVGKNAQVEYHIASINGGGLSNDTDNAKAFKIDPSTGVITTRMELDHEITQVYTLIVSANDQASPQNTRLSSSATVVIHIMDDNDNYPQFSERTYTVNLKEDIDVGSSPIVARIEAHDLDQGQNAAIRYALIGGNTQSQFQIDSVTGEVSLVKALDYETMHSYRLAIRAQDGGSPPRSNTTQLLVNVRDVNDNSPRFYTSLFQESIQESAPTGYSVLKVQAYDSDEGENADIRYSIPEYQGSKEGVANGETPDHNFPFTVDAVSGWITTRRELDREDQAKFSFHVVATDQGEPQLSASANVQVTIQDVNDNDPVFEPKVYECVVSEDEPPGTPVATVIATDADQDAKIHYELTGGNTRGRFAITSQNAKGVVSIAQPLDYKQEKRYTLTVTASDSGGRKDHATIYVNVSDANNFAPVFEHAPYTASVFEDVPIGTTVLVVSAQDNDVGINAQISYSLNDHSSEFIINEQTGAIITAKLLDRETMDGYLLSVTARDAGHPSLFDTTDVEISVSDVNDNYPVFKQPAYSGSITEDALVGSSVVQVSATDADSGLNGRIRYTLSERDQKEGSFVIDPSSGVVRTNKGLDRESMAVYDLEAFAIDRGSPTLSTSVPVQIRIEDINDSPPVFASDKMTLYISENSPIGSTVGEIFARDPDEGVNAIVQYSIIGGEDASSFSLVTRPGSEKADLITMTELDYESSKKQFDLVIRAASPPLRSDVQLQVVVTDVNDNAPKLQDFSIVFNNYLDHFPTGPIGRIPAFDADVTDRLHYKILTGNNAHLVALNESTGHLVLSPQLNTNVAKIAAMEVSVFDGVNEVKAIMTLSVRLVTEDMLENSVTVRLNRMTKEAFLSPLFTYFLDGLAAIIRCPKDNIYIFSLQEDHVNNDSTVTILNVSFSVRKPDVSKDAFYSVQFLQEKVYLNRAILARLSTVQVLPFQDNLCVVEPCLNHEQCLSILQFGQAGEFISSDTVLFRPIYPTTTFACRCPTGFTGYKEHYLCDTEVNLCYSSPCQHNGTCKVREGGYTCVCSTGYTGDNCEIRLPAAVGGEYCKSSRDCPTFGSPITSCQPKRNSDGKFVCEECSLTDESQEFFTSMCQLRSRSFAKGSFLTFPSMKQRYRFHLELRFATQSRNGLLLYNGRYNEQHDFIALEIIENRIQFSYSLGSNETKSAWATIPGGVADGNWHKVVVVYLNMSVTISIDDCDTSLSLKYGSDLGGAWGACAGHTATELEARCALLTSNCHRFLDLTGPLQIGGLPSIPNAEQFQTNSHHFDGCIADVSIDYKMVDLKSFVTDNGTTLGCPEKRSFCDSRPCLNGGDCFNGWDTYVCRCQDGFGGQDCSRIISTTWQFGGDGQLAFNPLLRTIQLPWLNSLSLRTRQKDAFLMSIQVGQNSTVIMSLENGQLLYRLDDEVVALISFDLSNGQWHTIAVEWLGTELHASIDYGTFDYYQTVSDKIQGLYVGKIVIGAPDHDPQHVHHHFQGCIQDVRIGNAATILNRPASRDNVDDGCFDTDECVSGAHTCPARARCVRQWRSFECECEPGYVGTDCLPVCSLNPCQNGGHCVQGTSSRSTTVVPDDDTHIADYFLNKRGYHCQCGFGGLILNNTGASATHCEATPPKPCPASWWGYPVCGPCNCPLEAGYDPDCNKTTGECSCRENHYQPQKALVAGHLICKPCDCYHVGSVGMQCDHETGQCRCRDGVIGLKCDQCPNLYAEVTLQGCQVIYDGCPRHAMDQIWWPRTSFGAEALESCPKGSQGQASRMCDAESGRWLAPDLFNCTSDKFVDLRHSLQHLEQGALHLNTFVSIKLAMDLYRATNWSVRTHQPLYGADVLITDELLTHLIQYEIQQSGLNLTHSQDKDYVHNIVHAVSVIMSSDYTLHWERVRNLTNQGPEHLIQILDHYLQVLATSQHDTYTSPFELVADNAVLALDIVTAESIFGYETRIPSKNHFINEQTTQRIILPDTSQFLFSGPIVSIPKYNNYMLNQKKFDTASRLLIPFKLLGLPETNEYGIRSSYSDGSPNGAGAVISYMQYRDASDLMPARYHESVVRRWGVDLTICSALWTVSILVPNHASSYGGYRNLANTILEQPIRFQMRLDPTLSQRKRIILTERSHPQCVYWNGMEWSRVGCRTELEDGLWYEMMDELDVDAPTVNCSCNHLSTFAVLVDVVHPEYIPEPSLLESISSYGAFSISLPLLLITYLILALIRGLKTNSNTIRKHIVLCVFVGELLYFVAWRVRGPLIANDFACKLTAIGLHYVWLAAFFWMLIDAIHLYRMLIEMRDINHGPMRFYSTMGYVVPAVVVSLSVGVRAHHYGNYYFCWLSLHENVVWSLVGPICLLVFINMVMLVMAIRAAFTLKDHVLGYGNLRTLLWVSVVALPLLGCTWLLALLSATESHPFLMPSLSTAVVLHATFSLVGYCFANRRVRENLIRSFMRCMGKKVPLLEGQVVAINPVTITAQQSHTRSSLSYHHGNPAILDPTVRRNIGISTSSTTSRSTTKTSSSPYRSDAHLRQTSTSTSNYNNSTSDVPSYLRSSDTTNSQHQQHTAQNYRRSGDTNKRSLPHHPSARLNVPASNTANCSDSDSEDVSEGRSLDLASSHSSDDDESSMSRRRSALRGHGGHPNSHRRTSGRTGGHNMLGVPTASNTYLPNITEHASSRCGTPPSLNVVTKSQLFPSVAPTTLPHAASRWASHAPDQFLPTTTNEMGSRWSGSDNEFAHRKNHSPNPLPNPDVMPDTCLPTPLHSEQYMVRTSQPHLDYGLANVKNMYKTDFVSKMMRPHHSENLNYSPEYNEHRASDFEDNKNHITDKYLFPYTAEEDHLQVNGNNGHNLHYMPQPSSRMMSPITALTTNHLVGSREYLNTGSSRMGSILGSVHSGSLRGTPSPMLGGPQPVSLMHSSNSVHLPDGVTKSEEQNEETPV